MTSYQFIFISHLSLHCSSHLTNPVKDWYMDLRDRNEWPVDLDNQVPHHRQE